MSPTTLLIIVLGLLSLTDFFRGQRYETLHRQLYAVALFFFCFIVSIKYYYGSDILTYYPHYIATDTPLKLIRENINNTRFEFGYELYCSILNYIGLSFWWMTFLITVLYFYTINKLFKRLNGYKIFALLLIVFFEYNLFFFEYRQSLSVSFFILSFLALEDKKYFRYVLFTILTILCHKSGIIISGLALFAFLVKFRAYSKKYYILLFFLLVIMVFVPIKEAVISLMEIVPLNSTMEASIKMHLDLTKQIQAILIIYLILFFILSFFDIKDVFNNNWHRLMIVFFFIIVFFYQDYFLLNRIRSYFIPIAIVYVINILESKITRKQYSNVLILIFTVYIVIFYSGFKLHTEDKKAQSGVNEFTTVFALTKASEGEIRNEKMKKAKKFWENEYKKTKK